MHRFLLAVFYGIPLIGKNKFGGSSPISPLPSRRPAKYLFLVWVLLLVACRTVTSLPDLFITPTPTPTLTPTPTATATPQSDFQVIDHPDGGLYVGDQVSFEVVAPSGFQSRGRAVQLSFQGQSLGEAKFQPYGIGDRSEAIFYWAWDTHDLQAGPYTLDFSINPGGILWQEQVTLRPVSALPSAQQDAHWETASVPCCSIHYISGTDAARDIDSLKQTIETQAEDVEKRMGQTFPHRVQLTLMSRVLGQGGFTSDAIYVSYLDQNYAGSTAAIVIHHELVHALDGTMGGDDRPSILQEGLAVYITGGHFKPEPIVPRAAVVLATNDYIPLEQLSNDFYSEQHEVGYIEAAALVSYMVQTYGWQNYNAFYRDIHPAPNGQPSDAIDAALQKHFQLSFHTLEQNYIAFLKKQTYTPTDVTDVHDTISFYDTMRHYERLLDPSAYFATAWLPDGNEMRQRGIVADFLRHPHQAINQRLESLLVSADADLLHGDYASMETKVATVNMALDAFDSGSQQ